MTSEVLILNKKAVVLGADSAVTTSAGGDHPRYSKSANKIFELSQQGSVAVAIYGSASVDGVPWELAIKLFRAHLGARTFDHVSGYAEALIEFLDGNDKLFPPDLRDRSTVNQFDIAVERICAHLRQADPMILDAERSIEERRVAWETQEGLLRASLLAKGIAANLDADVLDATLRQLEPWALRAARKIDIDHADEVMDMVCIAELAHQLRYAVPHLVLPPPTGLVVTGYGNEEIFPAYQQLQIRGHIGDDLIHQTIECFEISHSSIAKIQPLAQTSMVDMFTHGFGESLSDIVDALSEQTIGAVFNRLELAGIAVPPDLKAQISSTCQSDFMASWRSLNWQRNYAPLLDTLHGLSVPEMAHLAESLLGLESLKERLTSPSESISGPIDVAAITKNEGLVWIRRKHFFDLALNLRYATRLDRSFE